MLPSNEYVELRNEAYYIAGTRIGLDVLAYAFQDGRSPESFFESFPASGHLSKVYGAITFILEHPDEVKQYLEAQQRRFHELQQRYPLPPQLLQPFEDAKRKAALGKP